MVCLLTNVCIHFLATTDNSYSISGIIAPRDEHSVHDTVRAALKKNRGNNGNGTELCRRISSSLDPSSWSDVIYHKDRQSSGDRGAYDKNKFSSVEEDDEQARSTIDEFNKLRKAILTPRLLDLGLSIGRMRPARAFAGRLRASLEGEEQGGQRPLIIAVFGSSFTIGSNCGESSAQSGGDCAWPMRLARRFDEIFPHQLNSSSLVEWRMYQENAQNSANVAQRLPSILDEFRDRNATPDAILLDNTIIDVHFGIQRPWFEAVVREFIRSYPDTVIVSLIDAAPSLVDVPGNDYYDYNFVPWLHRVQDHYGLAVVDIAKMVQHLRLHDNENGGDHEIVQKSIDDFRKRQNLKVTVWDRVKRWLVRRGIITAAYTNEDSTFIDILWPQSSNMITSNGTIVHNIIDEFDIGEVYWLNFLPRTRKTRLAWWPQNHPPWATHQYVADAMMRALMGVANAGLGCGSQGDYNEDDRGGIEKIGITSMMDETVSPRETLEDCFICRSPTTRINAKSPEHAGGRSVVDLTSDAAHDADYHAAVAVTCGDWRWITDGRNRSGWQSDQKGSLLRFRLKINNNTPPTLSMIYMRSHQTFGDFMVTTRAVSRKEASWHSRSSLLGCKDVSKFKDIGWRNEPEKRLQFIENATLIPSLELMGDIPQYSLWETVVFPAKRDDMDVVSERPWNLLNRTLLSRMMMSDDDNDEDVVEYVDLYVMNPYNRRVKVQAVTAC
ncbi:hypothetical protein ACHAXA_011449 [Cyclostephanos tholiformis]|uniref:Uncharacterized protein n=1 Tax=Cyclostephanos tholiformis TaxID=382380 RepID=A0ABD3RVV2_9STRA